MLRLDFAITGLCLAMLVTSTAGAESYDIPAATWQQPRSAGSIKAIPAVQQAVAELLKAKGQALVIRHGSDEEGTLWGAELHDWLISLGLAPGMMRLEVSDALAGALQLEVLSAGGSR